MPAYSQYIEQLPKSMREMFSAGGMIDFSTPVGYFNAELFSFMLPLLLIVFGIGFGAAAIAGDEEKGTLGFLLANPVPRWRVVVDKFGALTVTMILLGSTFWLGLTICIIGIGIDINLIKLAEATIGSIALALVFSAISFFVGCYKGNRSMSLGIASGLAVLTYFLNVLGGMVSGLKNYRFLSPFYQYMQPNTLVNGLDLHILVLAGLIVLFFAISIPAFIRRDITV